MPFSGFLPTHHFEKRLLVAVSFITLQLAILPPVGCFAKKMYTL